MARVKTSDLEYGHGRKMSDTLNCTECDSEILGHDKFHALVYHGTGVCDTVLCENCIEDDYGDDTYMYKVLRFGGVNLDQDNIDLIKECMPRPVHRLVRKVRYDMDVGYYVMVYSEKLKYKEVQKLYKEQYS